MSAAEKAFTDALVSGDEMRMLQLLRSTGPVATELGASTLAAVVRMLVTLLNNRSYMDVGLQWFEQLLQVRPHPTSPSSHTPPPHRANYTGSSMISIR